MPISTGTISITVDEGGKDGMEDVVKQLEYFLYDASGHLVARSGHTANRLWIFEVNPGKYEIRVCSGISPGATATLAEFDHCIAQSSDNIYSNGCFPMFYCSSAEIHEGQLHEIQVTLQRLFGKITVRSLDWIGDGTTPFGDIVELRLDKILIMDAPGSAYITGGQAGGNLLNRWDGSAFEECSGSDADCTIMELACYLISDKTVTYANYDLCSLYCLPSDGASLVFQCTAVYDDLEEYCWYYSLPLYIASNHHYNYGILILGPGADDPLGNRSRNIIYCGGDIDEWVECDGQNIDF